MSNKQSTVLREMSISSLFYDGEKCKYEIPVYQRNYAWEKDEISALVRDVYDSFCKPGKPVYYIGTLVTYYKDDGVYEVIDGQQRLTTIYLMLRVLFQGKQINNMLTYRARVKSDRTIEHIPRFDIAEVDSGILNGYKYACDELSDKLTDEFRDYFLHNVHIIRYIVPKDIDLNHYFEIMNSRGEQLEKHEIVKAKLMQNLTSDEDRHTLHLIWESCSEMSVYVQQRMSKANKIFGDDLCHFLPENFRTIKYTIGSQVDGENDENNKVSISDILNSQCDWIERPNSVETKDSFQPIIDFPNFLLIVLKIIQINDDDFDANAFNLDDKELINEFDKANMGPKRIRRFAYTLLKARFLLDNYVVHHAREEDSLESNPWKLQVWNKDRETNKEMLRNLVEGNNNPLQNRLVQVLSMFEVSFTARQRKNYLFYSLMYLFSVDINNFAIEEYASFLDDMADRFFRGVYLSSDKLSNVNKPLPGSFDEVMLYNGKLNDRPIGLADSNRFCEIYGDGSTATKGIPLFVFSYTDYSIWKYYDSHIRGKEYKKDDRERIEFFKDLGCSDFDLYAFDRFYFSRTRRSLEHYYPQNTADGLNGHLNEAQINCFGNFAMIGAEANSAGSDWDPFTKLDHYMKDASKHMNRVSVASLKFWIMMQMCSDEGKWEFEQIQNHQQKMLNLLFGD